MAALNLKNIPNALYRKLQERARHHHRSPHSILELQGLGKELWTGIDAAKHVDAARESWD